MSLVEMVTIPKEEHERLLHHEATTIGLWATDRPECFELKYEYIDKQDGTLTLFEIRRTLSNGEI